MTSLSLNFLGPFQVTLDEVPATDFRSDKVRALLAYLSMEADQPHRREALAGLLWPDMSDRTARKNLRLSIHRLRQTLADLNENPDHILVTRETVQFNLADCWLDVHAFEACLEESRTHAHQDVKKCPDCIDHLEEAALIYRGDFLQGFHLDDSLAFSEWALVKREALHRRALNVLYQLAGHFHQSNNFEAALNYAWRQLELEPWREEAHRQVMEILARRGERSAALAQFHACRRILSEEFGVEPAEETIAAYDRIRLVTSGIRHNLPNQPTGFVGREEELHELTGLLDNPECRLLTIFGPGGIGKTRLALEAAGARVQSFLNGVFYVPLSPVGSPDFLVSAIAEALQLPLSGAQNPAEQLVNYLRDREILLILDSFEHLVEGTGLLVEILQTAPRVKLLVTSRERLNLSWDWCVEIEGLKVPPREIEQVEELEKYSAVQLFQQSARRVNRRFSLSSVSHSAVVRICQLVEGTPLGIELAAAGVGSQSCEEIAREVERNLDNLETNLQDLPPRHRSLRATFERSWNLLDAAEQQGCANLSVFRRGFQREAAEAVADAGRNLLKSLVDKSLLRYAPPGRYEFHELLRQFAADKLAAEIERQGAIGDRHCGYYIALLDRWESDLFGANAVRAQDAIKTEIENVRAAWHWAVEQSRLDEIERGLEGLANYYLLAGPFQEGEVLFRLAAEHVRSLVEDQDQPPCSVQVTLNKLRLQCGHFFYELGMYDQCKAVAEEVVNWASSARETCNPMGLEARGHLLWGRAFYRLGEFPGAQTHCERVLELARKTPLRREEARSLICLGNMADRRGHYEKTKTYLEQALRICQEIGDRQIEANVHNNLAIIFGSQGDYAGSRASFEQALHISRETGDLGCQASALNNLGLVSSYQGDYAMAKAYREQALQIYLELGERRGEGNARTGLGKALSQLGNYDEAEATFEKGLLISREVGDWENQGGTLKELGVVSWHRGDCVKARLYFEQALQVYHETGSKRMAGITLNIIGEVLSHQGEYIKGRDFHERALEIGREIGDLRLEANAYNGLAGVASRLGEYASARDLGDRGLQISREIADQQVEGMALAALGWVDDRLGEGISACDRYRQALGILAKISDRHLEGLVLTRLGRALVGLERLAEAADTYEKALTIRADLGQQGMAVEPQAGLASIFLAQDDLNKALVEVEKIYSCLPTAKSTTDEKHSLCSVDDLLWIYWTCYRVFNAGQDPRATDSLSAAYELLTEWAERFAELDQQRLFKENVAVHREILNAWDSLSDAQRPRSAWQTPNEPSAASNVGAQDGDEG